jgi:hypothetical protein
MQTQTIPTATPIVADPTLLTRLTVDWMVDHSADSERISKAHDIVVAGGVERTATPHLFLVVSQSQPNAAYHVDDRTGCHCPDAARRDARNCKHCWAVRLATQAERLEAEQADILDVDAPIAFELTPEAYELLDLLGEPCALPAQCPRCHAEPAILGHCDWLGQACLTAELFGGDAA